MGLRFLATLIIVATFGSPALAQIPRVLGYQGRLLRADGTAATGTASVTFTVHDSVSGGSLLWTETQTLGLSDGYYSTFLGLVAPPDDGDFDGGARWLQVQVGGETLLPRQQIGSVAFALQAASVRGSADVSSLKVGGQTVIDSSGRLQGAARYTGGPGIAIDASQVVSLQTCAAGQSLVRDATGWTCATPGAIVDVRASAPLTASVSSATAQLSLAQAGSLSGGYLSSTDWNAFDAKYGAATQCGGDLTGYLSAPVVARLQSRPVAATAPTDGQVLKWNGAASRWEPGLDADSHGTLTGLTGHAPLTVWGSATTPDISIQQATGASDGYLASADYARFDLKYDASTQCGGDLTGALSAPLVSKLQGVSVATAVPSLSQVLRFDGSRWAPASLQIGDVGGLSSGYLDLTGAQTISGSKTFASAPTFQAPLAVTSGGTGATAFAPGGVVFGGAGGTLAQDAAGLKWDAANSRLGVGASAPAWTLDVSGSANASAGLCIAGDCKTAWSAVGGYWSQNGTDIYNSTGTKVGVGTSAPAAYLDVSGVNSSIVGLNVDAASQTQVVFRKAGTATHAFSAGSGRDANVELYANGTSRVFVDTNGASYFNGGNVGIGTTGPVYKLDVRGPGYFATSAGTNQLTLGDLTNGLTASIAKNGTAMIFSPDGSDEGMRIATSGSVGIGTTAPQGRLDVASTGAQTSPGIAVRGAVGGGTNDGNALEWGHANGAGYGSTLGFYYSAGNPYVALNGESGSTINTFRTRGIRSSILLSDLSGGMQFGNVANASADNQTFSPLVTLKNDGSLGVGTTSPGSKLDVAGDVNTTGNLVFGGGPFYAQREAHADFSTAAAGWYRVAYTEGGGGRGQNTVTLYTTGGSWAPRSTQIRWWHDWSSTAGITVVSEYGDGTYWNAARITDEGDTTRTRAYLEVYFLGATSGGLSVQYDGGQAGGGPYGGSLTAGAGTVRASTVLGYLSVGGNRLVVHTSGNVGVGTTAPAAALDVAGSVRVANDTATCTSANAGAIRWNGSVFQGCNGSTWITFTAGVLGSASNPAVNCKAILNAGTSTSGLYWLTAQGTSFQAYCDMTGDTGGWTLVMRTWYTSSGGPCPGVSGSACNWFRNATGAVNTAALLGASTASNGKFSDAVVESIRAGGEYRWLVEAQNRTTYANFYAPATFTAPTATAAQMFTTAWFAFPRTGGGHTWVYSGSSSWGGWDGPDYGSGNFRINDSEFSWNAAASVAQAGTTNYYHANSSGGCGYGNPPSPCTNFGISVWVR